jgi:hypothetical protein
MGHIRLVESLQNYLPRVWSILTTLNNAVWTVGVSKSELLTGLSGDTVLL